ncbi:YraN family protein [Psychromonas sp. psych-6C06]|uniref:YraN family protein n=1 Tax=Psychromonas sp. psych-6C06 TaxID=2058089 RepID=UPI000C34A5DF|nr:YraN family protein [Psychromonas sp. psych-6C06]PKF63418.1 YraN family protein [Psychromonas sp. psych-6C06]
MKLPRLLQPSNSQGVIAEKKALSYLLSQGLTLLHQNYYCRFGEIDLIMADQDTLVFIEVRFRKNGDFGGALASINQSKQRKIIKTANHYIAQLASEPYCRFDAIALNDSDSCPLWVQDAFQV